MLKTPRRWTTEEDSTLLAAVSKLCGNGDVKDWTTIAKALPGRTNKDCRKRWTNRLVGGLKKGPWDADEDDRLRGAVEEFGDQWTLVAEEVGGRSADQCAKRWNHSLDPTLDQSKWTRDEEKLLLEAVKKHGRAWKQIQKQYFSDRASNNIKNRYVTLTRRRGSPANDEAPETSQQNVAVNVDDEMDGIELSTGRGPSSPHPDAAMTLVDQGYLAMLDDDQHQYLTDFAAPSFLDPQSMLVSSEAPLSGPEPSPLLFSNADFASLPDLVPDSYFTTSSASSGEDTPLHTSAGGLLDHFDPSQLCEDFSDQLVSSDDVLAFVDELQSPQSSMFTLRLDNPNPETMVGVMSFLAHSKIKFKLEIN